MLDAFLPAEFIPYMAAAHDAIVSAFLKFFGRFHWLFSLPAVVLAFFAWLYYRRDLPEAARTNFLKFLFPKNIWLHRSALLDYRFVFFDKVALGIIVGLAGVAYAAYTGNGAEAVAKATKDPVVVSAGIVIAYTVALLLVEDFFRYWAHRIMHESKFLWQFHKVHHSPEVLVPFSQMRTHPVNGLVNAIRSGLAIGIVTGAFLLIFPGKLSMISILGVNIGRFTYNLMGAHLRHSHVWLSFGPALSHIFISPAMHQIHHSKLARHIDKNYGSQFALWDWMFGTIYIPKEREELVLGISKKDTERMQTVWQLYWQPFKDAAKVYRQWRDRRRAQVSPA
jgi:sterol desaturase/sphingolipid hydroxylase (fatty acid hydroxylase superfamily)